MAKPKNQPASKHTRGKKAPRDTKGRGKGKQVDSGHSAARPDVKQARGNKNEAREKSDSDSEAEEIKINRSPVLTLWVSVVAERLGFSKEEAYTYGRWVSSALAATRDRKVESVQPTELSGDQDTKGRREKHEPDKNHVQVFAQMKTPVKRVKGKRLAVMARQGKLIDPETVDRYLHKKFGDNLGSTHDAMMELAQSMDADDVRNRAYDLFSQFKPDTEQRGKAGVMDLEKLHDMAKKGSQI